MKKIIFFLIICFTGKTLYAESISLSNGTFNISADTSSYPIGSLSGVNWSFYINQPINTLLLDLTELFPGYILSQVYPKDRLSMASQIKIYYADKIALLLTVREFEHLNPVSHDGGWDTSLFTQENLSQIELMDHGECVYNSNP